MTSPESNAFAWTVAVNSISPALRTTTPSFSATAAAVEKRKRRIAAASPLNRPEECIACLNGRKEEDSPVVPIETVLNARVPVKVWTDQIEPQAMVQLKNTASLPFVFRHVAAMPDVHLGIGATVGSVVATKGAVCPAAVGVDIGCGMIARKTAIPADRLDGERLKKLRHSIEREIPVGFQQKKQPFDQALSWA